MDKNLCTQLYTGYDFTEWQHKLSYEIRHQFVSCCGGTDPDTGCIEWLGGEVGGLPKMLVDDKRVNAKEVIMLLYNRWPDPGGVQQMALNTCGNPSCVNIHHLIWIDPMFAKELDFFS